ncbi:hypothetical protein [Rhodococcus xishaensis]|uniref:Uncharacterized protein n=1 Tax=Rhodococcus xishaensis TaxID=2487364 RepID=A0A438AWG1_9NOCA|nr:hypothetical protein [Rhodococcus xishaensis]RVW03028.1 hypothetical protein EGT50_09985 [Rhodococcus xishaensis]
MSEIQVFADADLAYQAVMLKALADTVLDAQKRVRHELAQRMAKGDRLTARDGDAKLGSVNLTDPKPKATVTDEAAFADYLTAKYGDEATVTVELGDVGEICAVLADSGHEDLFTVRQVFPAWVREQAIKDALLPRHTVPGVTVTVPAGVVSARTEQAAVERVRAVLSGGDVRVLAIEGGAQ